MRIVFVISSFNALFRSIKNAMTHAKPTVLAIDDEAINIQVIREILGNAYELIFATDGVEGLALARSAHPDVILLDINMPGLSGYEVCAQLKSDAATAAIPIIFVTALDSTQEEIQGLEAGALDYLTKPLNRAIVQARVRNQLEFKRSVQQAALPEPDTQGITPRQKEILEWMQLGKTNSEIASIIGFSEDNVKYHIKKIMEKLDAHSRALVVAKAASLRIISFKK